MKETKGGGHTGAMAGGMVATAIVFFPAAPLFLFMHGKDITIPKGTEITAYVNGDLTLDPVEFALKTTAVATSPTAAPATLPSVLSGTPLTNADVVTLKEAGLSDYLVIAKMKASPAAFSLNTDDLIALKGKVSEAVIAAMIEAQGRK